MRYNGKKSRYSKKRKGHKAYDKPVEAVEEAVVGLDVVPPTEDPAENPSSSEDVVQDEKDVTASTEEEVPEIEESIVEEEVVGEDIVPPKEDPVEKPEPVVKKTKPKNGTTTKKATPKRSRAKKTSTDKK